ncbi:precorrin-6y C5,15-methyltransferase (decarboxylating), CbiE subunit, partial [gut metagenome]
MKREGQQVFCAYQAEEIFAYIEEHPQYERVAVVLSGDVGFFSGAKEFLACAKKREEEMEIRVIPGISSLVYFCAKLRVPWEKVKAVSVHGREEGLISSVREHPAVFALAGGKNQIAKLCKKLTEYGFGECEIAVGEKLSYPEERIWRGKVRECCELETESLSVFLI